MKLVDWLEAQVIDDQRALAWFDEDGADDRIARAFRIYRKNPRNLDQMVDRTNAY